MDNGASSYRRFLDGDDEGIVEIVTAYKDGLILFLKSLINNVHTAEELAEDTFFRLMIKKPKFSEKSSFKSWLYSIGRHIAIDYIRRNSKTKYISEDDERKYLNDEFDLERSYIKEEKKITVHKALEKLPADYRQVIWLMYFEGLSNREVSNIMEKSPRQITNLLYRAKQSLKSQLEKEDFDYEEF